jgi:hypothetical protein
LIGWLAGIALVVVIVFWIMVAIQFHRYQEAPDVSATARSSAVVAADRGAAAETSSALTHVAPRDASWLTSGPTTVSDYCVSNTVASFGEQWGPTRCIRTVLAYYYFNGTLKQDTDTWDAALRANGWSGVGTRPGSTSGYYSRGEDDEATGELTLHLSLRWVERPQLTPTSDPADNPSTDPYDATVAWIEKPAVTPDAVESAAFAHYRYVAIASLTVVYYDTATATS